PVVLRKISRPRYALLHLLLAARRHFQPRANPIAIALGAFELNLYPMSRARRHVVKQLALRPQGHQERIHLPVVVVIAEARSPPPHPPQHNTCPPPAAPSPRPPPPPPPNARSALADHEYSARRETSGFPARHRYRSRKFPCPSSRTAP